jgi:radical SAM superfamily enzyme YgiQ (UPF0313 family)
LAYARDGVEQRNPAAICGYRNVRFTGFDQLDLAANRRKGYHDCGFVTHSGCPLGCSFCDAHRTFGREYVLRDIPTVVDELTELRRKHGARSIWLVNSGINRPLAYGKELCARIAEARLGLYLACIIEPGEFDAEMAGRLKKAGAAGVMIFGTSLDDGVLERNQPFYRRADVVQAAELMRDARLDYYLGQMYGAPGETLDGVTESLKLAYRLKPVMIITGYGFRVQPDTPLREVAVQAGVVGADDDCFTPKFYLSPEAPADGVKQRIRRFRLAHPWQVARFIGFVGRSIAGSVFNRGQA